MQKSLHWINCFGGTTSKEFQKIELQHGGKTFVLNCGPKRYWKAGFEGTKRLWNAGRLVHREGLRIYKRYFDDFPYAPYTTTWRDTRGETDMTYAVQTSRKVVERCILMTTDPGDIVFDPTCGSGTIAYVSEQWGRRWITCDTSRVAIALAKQRLMTSIYDYHQLAHSGEGVSGGFIYATVPHVTLGSIANNKAPSLETLYDKPLIDKSKTRITGPLTIEAVPSQRVLNFDEAESLPQEADASIGRSGETIRMNDWIGELQITGIRAKSGQKIEYSRIEPISGTTYLHAEGETKESEPKRAVISFGPAYSPLGKGQVELAIQEAQKLVPKPKVIVFTSFQFDPEAAKDIDETNWPGVMILKAQMNTDLLTADLKKKRSGNESFWLVGQPDVELKKQGQQYIVKVNGFDYYNPKTGEIESGDIRKVAMWMLDTDYDGRSLYPDQIFFPMAGEDEGWGKLAKNLRAALDEDLIEKVFKGDTSLPFKLGDKKRIAVKIIDDRGIESLRIIEVKQ